MNLVQSCKLRKTVKRVVQRGRASGWRNEKVGGEAEMEDDIVRRLKKIR